MTTRRELRHQRAVVTTSPVELNGEVVSRSGATELPNPETVNPETAGAIDPAATESKPEKLLENANPLKSTISIRPGRLARIVHRLNPRRGNTPQEIAILEEKQRRKAMEKLLREEANEYKRRFVKVLTRMGCCYEHKKRDGFLSPRFAVVKFKSIIMTPDAFFFEVDTLGLPYLVGVTRLMQEEIVTELSFACGHRVSCQYKEDKGFFYIVERSSGMLGIPRHVMYMDMLKAMPDYMDRLTVPLGLTSNTRPVYRSFSQMFSMLVAGTIGSGKSNALNVMLCTLIHRNTPRQLGLMLIDLKGGLEFGFYEGIPHLIKVEDVAPNGIATQKNQVVGMLRWLHGEGERRLRLLKGAGCKDIARYNQKHRRDFLSHLILVIDEWADIKMLPAKESGAAEELLVNIAQRLRAVGIHVIVCTQVPKTEVLTTRIKGVLPAKLAYSCPTQQGSMAILDNANAKMLQPAGRAILQWTNEIQIQTPYINDEIIQEIIRGAISGTFADVDKGHDVTLLEILEYALNEDDGNLSRNRLFKVFEPRGITQLELSTWLQEIEGTEVIIGSAPYRIEPAAGTRPRRQIAISQDQEEEPEKPKEETHEPV